MKDKSQNANQPSKQWIKPAIEWEEDYEPVVFAASCTSEAFNCGGGAHN